MILTANWDLIYLSLKGPGALLAKIEYDGILGNPQSLMCKKRQITYRYFMFCWLKVKKSPGGLIKPHYHHGGKIWFSLVKNVNISRQLSSDWLKMWHSPLYFLESHTNHDVMRFCLCFHISWGPSMDFVKNEQILLPLVERVTLTDTRHILHH